MAGVFLLDCPHCPATKSSFSVVWAAPHREGWQCTGTCGGCAGAVVAIVSRGHQMHVPPSNVVGNISNTGFSLLRSWPTREIPTAPPFTPEAPAKRFRDGEFNFQNELWNASCGMYRAALDLSTKHLNAEGATFYKRLQWLRDQDRVTADIREWADHVRVEGNGALHDEPDISKEDATALRHFTTMFLRYVFEMPGLVAQFRTPPPA